MNGFRFGFLAAFALIAFFGLNTLAASVGLAAEPKVDPYEEMARVAQSGPDITAEGLAQGIDTAIAQAQDRPTPEELAEYFFFDNTMPVPCAKAGSKRMDCQVKEHGKPIVDLTLSWGPRQITIKSTVGGRFTNTQRVEADSRTRLTVKVNGRDFKVDFQRHILIPVSV